MARRLAFASVLAVLPVLFARLFMWVTTDPDDGANIGGGLLLAISGPVGLSLALGYLLSSTVRRPPRAKRGWR